MPSIYNGKKNAKNDVFACDYAKTPQKLCKIYAIL